MANMDVDVDPDIEPSEIPGANVDAGINSPELENEVIDEFLTTALLSPVGSSTHYCIHHFCFLVQ